MNEKKQICGHKRDIKNKICSEIDQIVNERLDLKCAKFENINLNTVCKYGNVESLEDEFKAFQVKVQDQVKLEVTKSHES